MRVLDRGLRIRARQTNGIACSRTQNTQSRGLLINSALADIRSLVLSEANVRKQLQLSDTVCELNNPLLLQQERTYDNRKRVASCPIAWQGCQERLVLFSPDSVR